MESIAIEGRDRLRQRLARGEITLDEYDQISTRLSAAPSVGGDVPPPLQPAAAALTPKQAKGTRFAGIVQKFFVLTSAIGFGFGIANLWVMPVVAKSFGKILSGAFDGNTVKTLAFLGDNRVAIGFGIWVASTLICATAFRTLADALAKLRPFTVSNADAIAELCPEWPGSIGEIVKGVTHKIANGAFRPTLIDGRWQMLTRFRSAVSIVFLGTALSLMIQGWISG